MNRPYSDLAEELKIANQNLYNFRYMTEALLRKLSSMNIDDPVLDILMHEMKTTLRDSDNQKWR
jgi:hypothetical protein